MGTPVARLFYTLLFHLLLPFVLLRLLWRARRAPDYLKRVGERLGFGIPAMRGGLWVHAVSVGETLAAAPLINAWRKAHPGEPVFVSTMTPTGSARVHSLWGASVHHAYAPWDLPWAWALFLHRVRPDRLVIMETELWPNMIHAARKRGIPVILANARLSERSARGYARAGWLVRPMLAELSQVAAQDDATAGRFRALGVPAERITVTGSVKFDITPPADIEERAHQLHVAWKLAHRLVIVAASTHSGEDIPVLMAFAAIRARHKHALLILVPRHPERFENVASTIQQKRFTLARRSRNEAVTPDTAVLLGDTMGELMLWFALADIAFVGGSLVPVGGHNVLEPMALDVPTLSGPYIHNFQTIADELVAAGALQLVTADELAKASCALLDHPEMANARVQAAREVLLRNRGALERQLALIDACGPHEPAPAHA
ncbi:MAG TPA: lipid IV(A) 3-deoxy-D-manno-octulosonic acid transferase [Moraxellaceae bacterium]|nr:lipid IV(A) 3-deoxy-D-manno-octulosonic acid transferase [Moraxellaceae bacterium]